MTPAALETLLRIAMPPLKLALRERYLVVPSGGAVHVHVVVVV